MYHIGRDYFSELMSQNQDPQLNATFSTLLDLETKLLEEKIH